MNKSYDIKLKELTMLYQNEGDDRETSKQVIVFNNKRDGIHRIVVKGVCKR